MSEKPPNRVRFYLYPGSIDVVGFEPCYGCHHLASACLVLIRFFKLSEKFYDEGRITCNKYHGNARQMTISIRPMFKKGRLPLNQLKRERELKSFICSCPLEE